MDIQDRAFEFAVDIVRLCASLQTQTSTLPNLHRALLQAGTAIAAQVEAAHGSAKADFITAMQAAAGAARQTHYWLRLLAASEQAPSIDLAPLTDEAQQLAAILTSIVKTAKRG
jgi:four helix bundle protein